jgi:hypothetical protein
MIIDFMGQILSFPNYNGGPVVQAPNYSSFYMGWVIRMKIKIAASVCLPLTSSVAVKKAWNYTFTPSYVLMAKVK